MALDLQNFRDESLDPAYVAFLLDREAAVRAARYERLWAYFRNLLLSPSDAVAGVMNSSSRPYVQAQEIGLPSRITGVERSGRSDHPCDLRRKEVVIENDIAWRIHAMVDFLFGKGVTIRSLAPDAAMAGIVERVASALLEAGGGVALLEEIALLGSVYGFVDIALRAPADAALVSPTPETIADSRPAAPGVRRPGTPDFNSAGDDSLATASQLAVAAAAEIQLEPVEAPRIIPLLDENDSRRVRYWIQRFMKRPQRVHGKAASWLRLPWMRRGDSPAAVEVVEIIGPAWWQRYEDRVLVAEGENGLGRLSVVHIPNITQPGAYEGLSDVEPLIPLQDELNTRLSDRANRVTYQSFKMYLGKGIEDFLDRPVGPGQMWATQNLAASIEEFGSDNGSPSEDAHIEQVRQAMDKVSCVTPLAAGLLRDGLGNLSSATALRVVLSGLLSRTARKRLTYGAGLKQIVELALAHLDAVGVLRTRPADRRVEILWPSPLPADEGEQLRNALIKTQLGVPADRILAELGYRREDDAQIE
jgi:hypothetical protein